MIGIIVQLLVSWLLIWLIEKKNLGVLGLFPTGNRIRDFFMFFLIAAVCSASGFILKMLFGIQQWKLNPDVSLQLILNGALYNIKSVLFEELIFRGVLLFILIKRIGATKAMIISAAAFGMYHWLSFGVMGDPVQMTFVFLITGIMGLLYAYGYAKTFSLYIPIGIHLGWNIVQSVVFSDTNIGNHLFVPINKTITGASGLLLFLVGILPMLSLWFIGFALSKKKKQVVST